MIERIKLELGDKYITLYASTEAEVREIRTEIEKYTKDFKLRLEVPIELKSIVILLKFPSVVSIKYIGEEVVKLRANIDENDKASSIIEYVTLCEKTGLIKAEETEELIALGRRLLCS